MLESAGLKLSDVKLVNVNFALTPALMSGQVDAVIGAFRNFELTELKMAGKPGRAFYPEEHGVPAYDELIYIVKQDRAADPRIAALPRRRREGHAVHPEQARRRLEDLRRHRSQARRRAEQAGLDRHPAPPAGQLPPPSTAKRYRRFARVHEGARPDRDGRAGGALRRVALNRPKLTKPRGSDGRDRGPVRSAAGRPPPMRP